MSSETERGVQETQKRASFVRQPGRLRLLCIHCTFTKGSGRGEEEAGGGSGGVSMGETSAGGPAPSGAECALRPHHNHTLPFTTPHKPDPLSKPT